jgi:hypothetical protein
MAEAPVVDKVIHRPAKGYENVQIRQCAQKSPPEKGLPADLPAQDGLATGGAESELR